MRHRNYALRSEPSPGRGVGSRNIKYDVIALQETKGRTETIRRTDHNELLIIGAMVDRKNIGGVGFLANSTVHHLVDCYKIISPRVAVLRLETKDQGTISIMNGYAPTSAATDKEKEEFYKLFERTVNDEKSYYKVVELQAAFNKYKLKAKVKFDQLRKEVNAYCSGNGYSLNERENNALLLIRLAENETAMEAACREAEVLRKEVARKQTQLNDQLILIKNMEEQIRSSQPMSPVEIQERKRAAQMIDLDKIQQQMLFKDERIVELNNVILDKERQILDLQELCREQGEVASVTSQAARIVQRQWEDKNRERREVGTETDSSLWNSTTRIGQRDPEVRARSDSPGRAVVNNRGTANTSPPPLDPSEVLERTSRRDEADDHLGASNSFLGKSSELDSSFRKKNRKRVTFDLLSTFQQQQQQQAARTPSGEQFTQVVIELSEENERLRKALLEARTNLDQLQSRADEVDADMTRLVREGKNQALKARAVAQARIKELEDRMAELNGQHADQIDRLQTEIESLRSTREWEVEQNAQLREQLNEAKNKNHKLTEELDASEKANREWEVKPRGPLHFPSPLPVSGPAMLTAVVGSGPGFWIQALRNACRRRCFKQEDATHPLL
ncbi:unnamed protein product [Heligmosomoides polygyrus]|uniref:SAS-6_N domain-containing protein n=1 Tax=Heligmosomoides polygyrus TaxID=6339 RepID=A0A3P7ZLX9_HELPZ|nr:unnamed protein product [Heligmosomoides polygyrus]